MRAVGLAFSPHVLRCAHQPQCPTPPGRKLVPPIKRKSWSGSTMPCHAMPCRRAVLSPTHATPPASEHEWPDQAPLPSPARNRPAQPSLGTGQHSPAHHIAAQRTLSRSYPRISDARSKSSLALGSETRSLAMPTLWAPCAQHGTAQTAASRPSTARHRVQGMVVWEVVKLNMDVGKGTTSGWRTGRGTCTRARPHVRPLVAPLPWSLVHIALFAIRTRAC